jgi:hypothetical protein
MFLIVCAHVIVEHNPVEKTMAYGTDCGRPVRKSPSLHGRKSTPTPKYLGTAEAYFFCDIGPNFQISLIYAFVVLVYGSPFEGLT